jgi:hypothetical protein
VKILSHRVHHIHADPRRLAVRVEHFERRKLHLHSDNQLVFSGSSRSGKEKCQEKPAE